jgi:N-methylhydantoinase B
LVAKDVRGGKVSPAGARDDYGVVLTDGAPEPRPDLETTKRVRDRLRAERGPAPFFDRGPGYPRLSGGHAHAPVDL